jgi:hypothetical protein
MSAASPKLYGARNIASSAGKRDDLLKVNVELSGDYVMMGNADSMMMI